jgi:hypothetical protein
VTRWADSNNATAAAKAAVRMVTLADLGFQSGRISVHDGIGSLIANGRTYLGVGSFGGLDAVPEDLGGFSKQVTLTLSGVEPSLIGSAMTEDYQGKVVSLWIGLLNINSLAWIANPELLWEGRMDYMAIDLQQSTATIKMFCESRLQREPLIARYTDADQQLAYNGDNFFNLSWQIPLASANWGAISVTHPANRPPPGSGPGFPGGGGMGGGGRGRP